MDMPAVYIKHYSDAEIATMNYIKLQVPTVEQIQTFSNLQNIEQTAINKAKIHTARKKILVIINLDITTNQDFSNNNEDYEYIVANDAAQLCEAIACSTERIAAIIVKYHKASTYYYKKVRELSSAEGAVMIWSFLNDEPIKTGSSLNISRKSLPDLICLKTQIDSEQYWLGGKSELISLSV